VSWGELLDKITILQIKSERITDAAARSNVARELTQLKAIAGNTLTGDPSVDAAIRDLKSVNETLWEIEDRIRIKEREQSFDDAFIALARNVYKANDRRAAIKRRINLHLGSQLIEEKQYEGYERTDTRTARPRESGDPAKR
jgi:hypothetical protein